MATSVNHQRERWAGISGIIFVLLFIAFVISSVLTGEPASTNAQDYAQFYADEGRRNVESTTGELFVVLAMFFFLWFLGGLRGRLHSAEGASGTSSSVVFGAGLTFLVFFWAGNAVDAAFPAALGFFEGFKNDPQLAMVLSSLSFQLSVAASVGAGTLMAAASVVAIRTGVFPRWLAWIGFVFAAVALLGAVPGVGFTVLPVWVLPVSFFLLRPSRTAASAPAASGVQPGTGGN